MARGQPVGDDLVQPQRAAQVLEPILPEVSRPDAVDHLTSESPDRRLADDYVPALCDLADPRRPVDIEADVILVRDARLTCVEPYPDTHGGPVRPRCGCVPSLRRDDCP